MIKEIKVNFYRLVRSKSFFVVLIILMVGALISTAEIKICVDDPFDMLETAHEKLNEAAASEEDAQSFDIIFDSLNRFNDTNSLNGVVRMTFCSDLVCFLHCIVVSLFVANEFKSRFHVNHFSMNSRPAFSVFMEWFSLMLAIVFVEAFCYALVFLLCVILCHSFNFGDVGLMFKNGTMCISVMIAMASLAFMIAFLRIAGALAIVLSSIFAFGFFDFFLGIISAWFPAIEYYALNNLLSQISLGTLTTFGYAAGLTAILLYIAVFLGVTLIVAAKRDPY